MIVASFQPPTTQLLPHAKQNQTFLHYFFSSFYFNSLILNIFNILTTTLFSTYLYRGSPADKTSAIDTIRWKSAIHYMPGDLYGTVEVIPSLRRRASTEYSTGLEYTRRLLVDEDIVSRVRSFLLSRNEHWPPRTPSTSDEDFAQPEDCQLVSGFDFSSAKSVARLAHQTTGRLSVPEIRRAYPKSEMADSKPIQPKLKSILRTSSSANDLEVPGEFAPEPKKFQFPRLVLQDIKKSEMEGVKSCVEINPLIPVNDAELHQTELECCPPCDPADPQPSKYLVKHPRLPATGLEVEAADLACFMSGCEPGLKNCSKHRGRSESTSLRSASYDHQVEEDFGSIPKGLARLGISVQNSKSGQSFQRGGTLARPLDNGKSEDTLSEMRKSSGKSAGSAQKSVRPPTERALSPISSVTSGSTMDAFPLAVQSSELAAMEDSIAPFSTIVATNFSLPAYKQKRALQSLRNNLAGIPAPFDHTTGKVNVPAMSKTSRTPTNASISVVNHVFEQTPSDEDPARQPRKFSSTTHNIQGADHEVNRREPSPSVTPKMLSPSSRELSGDQQNDAVREKRSDNSLRSTTVSLKSKTYSPSLLSGTSRTSVIRHALLKSPAAEMSPVDTGLPVPPLLSTVSSLSEQIMPTEPAYKEVLKSAGSNSKGKALQRDTDYFDTNEAIGDGMKGPASIGTAIDVEDTAASKPGETGNTRVPISGHLTDLQKARDLVDSVRGRIQQAEEQMIQALAFEEQDGHGPEASKPVDTCSIDKTTAEDALRAVSKARNVLSASTSGMMPPISHVLGDCDAPEESMAEKTSFSTAEKGDESTSKSGHEISEDVLVDPEGTTLDSASVPEQGVTASPSQGGELSKSPKPSQNQPHQPPAAISNLEYWGFVPAVKEAVQSAVQIAVRNAVQEIVVPPGMDKAPNKYSQLMSASLERASKNADNCIQRASAKDPVPRSEIASEATVIVSGRRVPEEQSCTGEITMPGRASDQAADGQPSVLGTSPSRSPVPGSVSSRENDRGTGDDQTNVISWRQVHTPKRLSVTHQNRVRPCRPFSPEDLYTIPLDSDSKAPFVDANEARKVSQAYASKKPSVAGYTAIPTRHSSRNRVLNPKPKATNAFADVSAQGSLMQSRKRSFEPPSSRGGQGLRSVSSAGSLRSAESTDQDIDAVELTPLHPVPNRRKSMSSASISGERLGRKNTVHWLKDLLSTNGPYETRFTALPPRTRGARPTRSQTAPVKSIDELYVGRVPDAADLGKGSTKPQSNMVQDHKRVDISETFTRTIKDLENLMNEALHIARQATDSPEICTLQDGLEKSINVLHGSQKGHINGGADLPPRPMANRVQSRITATRCSDSDLSDMSVHESLKSYSGSSDSDGSDEENPPSPAQVRSVTVSAKKHPSRHSSGWPPTGRVSTPYPPASFPQSRASIVIEPAIQQDRNDFNDQIRAADPRSMRIETNVDITKVDTERKSKADIPPASRRMTTATFPPMGPDDVEKPVEKDKKPEFRNLEPFSAERRSTSHRKSSAKSPRPMSPKRATVTSNTGVDATDQAVDVTSDHSGAGKTGPLPQPTPRRGTEFVPVCIKEHSEEDHQAIRAKLAANDVPGKQEVRDYILENRHPPITHRASSLMLRKQAKPAQSTSNVMSGQTYDWQDIDDTKIEPCSQIESRGYAIVPEPHVLHPNGCQYSHSLDGSFMTHSEILDFDTGYGVRHRGGGGDSSRSKAHEAIELRDSPGSDLPQTTKGMQNSRSKNSHFSLGGKRHVSLRDHHVKGFSLARNHKRQKIARDWSPGRKRFVATVACISTALIGILVGIYAGETPAIQYYIVDFHHYTVLGNVFFFVGLAIPTFLFWPLPLLHGRKPYIMGSMSLAMPLLFPQALAVGEFRSPYVATWRVGLIMSRALMGFCLGFANMNFKQMLTDLFGASLQSTNPHQEHVDEFDVRRHGGGMGVWLGLWTWSALGSIGIGFMIGAVIINTLNPAWGFYVSICIIAFVMLLNVLCPEVRRSAFRRSVAEVVNDGDVSRRLARGEVKMHMVQTGPKWWGEEFKHGVILSQKMLRQPGFLIMALYTAWIYGQQVLITLVWLLMESVETLLTTRSSWAL